MSGSRIDQLHDQVNKLIKIVDSHSNMLDNALMMIQSQSVVINDLNEMIIELHDDMIDRR